MIYNIYGKVYIGGDIMKFVQAQFSLKYEPQIRIRRSANLIEDCLQDYYNAPQVLPVPDDIAPEAPRIVLASKNGHSSINFSQLSVDFISNFDGEYLENYEKTKTYIKERIEWLKQLLNQIGITDYYFWGITYNIHLDIGDSNPLDYIRKLLGDSVLATAKLYEVMQRITSVEADRYFVNRQISTFKEYQSKGITNPTLLDFSNSKLISEGVNLSLDVNNRYAFLRSGKVSVMDNFDDELNKIFKLIEKNFSEFEG